VRGVGAGALDDVLDALTTGDHFEAMAQQVAAET